METNNPNAKVQPSLMAADLPPAVRVFWDSAPENFRIPAILTAIDCYCALGTRLRAMYVYDLEPHALLLQVIVIGESGSGKSFTRPIVKMLMRPLKLRDKELKRQEQAYADLRKTNAKKLPEEPITDVRCLQTITKAKLVKRADMFIRKYGEPLAFWFYNEELATMTESNRRAFADLRTMDRLAYDLGAEYGSDTLSDASYNADVDVLYCSLFCGTENALDEYMDKRSVEGGNCTRKVLTNLGDLMGDDAPRFRQLTDGEQAMVNSTVKCLMDATYTDDGFLQPTLMVPMEWMDNQVKRWCQQQREQVLKTGSRAHNCFYKRASVSAFRMATLIYYLWGMDDKCHAKVTRFYRFMAQYILDGLLAKWGKRYEQMHKNEKQEESARQPLYDQLPACFTRDQLRELVVKLDLSCSVRNFIYKWRKARLIYDHPEMKDTFIKNYPKGNAK
ncbi:MAG: DUF3987 domain-containing protein [Bacteroidaceae bacterium]|nr:DUF3987 domain-containing protein [Bacteroidaceae bacterium]